MEDLAADRVHPELRSSSPKATGAHRCQEKNRKAQARFRERQKEKDKEQRQRLADLEASVQALEREREELARERTLLHRRTQLLESRLQQGSPALHPPAPQPPPPHLLSQPAELRGVAAWPPPPASAQAGTTVGSAGFEVTLPGNDVQCRGWAEFVEFYKGQILQMAPLLAAAQADPSCGAARTCERLLRELSQANRAIFHRNPAMRDKVHTMPIVQEGDQKFSGTPDKSLWQGVVAALHLTPRQQQQARELQGYFLRRMAAIMAQRQELCTTLMATCRSVAPLDTVDVSEAWHTNNFAAEKHAVALKAIADLHNNIADETLAQIEAGHGLTCKVMTPLQACSAFVGLYPWFPDKLAIMACIVEQQGAPAASSFQMPTILQ